MKAMALGGGHEVGASCIFLEIDGFRLVVDCGIRVGASLGENPLPDLDWLTELDAAIVTHAHLDHTGALPLLHQRFPQIPIMATEATIHLTQVLLGDSIRIMQTKEEEEGEVPLYDAALVESLFRRFITVLPASEAIIPGTDLSARFHLSGHILGAAMAEIRGQEGSVIVSGDISSHDQRTIPGMPSLEASCDLLILESTYGNRQHAQRSDEEARLVKNVGQVVAKGGKVLIPAFALGRAQEVILILQAYQGRGQLPTCPVWIDGMIKSICEVYNRFPELLQLDLAARVKNSGNPFFSKKGMFQAVRHRKKRETIVRGGPCVILSSSGMLSGGPSLFYATHLIGDKRNAILFTGYQDEEAPGGKLIELAEQGSGSLLLGEKRYEVKCQVGQYGLSAHADALSLAAIARRCGRRKVLLVHGDGIARAELAKKIPLAVAPDNGVMIDIGGAEARKKSIIEPIENARPYPTAEDLWLMLQEKGTKNPVITVSELSRLWFGQVSPLMVDGVDAILKEDTVYFSIPWQTPHTYEARSREQVALMKRRRELMGKVDLTLDNLIVLQNAVKHILPGICYATTDDGIEAWKVGKKGTTHFCEEIVEIIGPWEYKGREPGLEKRRLAKLITRAKGFRKKIQRERLWEELDRRFPKGATLDELVSCLYQEDDTKDLAFRLMLALHLHKHPMFQCQVVAFDEILYRAVSLGRDQSLDKERLEQNAAMALIDTYFSSQSGLYKKSLNLEKGAIVLHFNFPAIAKDSFEEERAQLEEESGWIIEFGNRVNMAVIKDAVLEILPQSSHLLANPSYHPTRDEVVIKLTTLPDGWDVIRSAFYKKTGLSLEAISSTRSSKKRLVSSERGLEMNEAFRMIEGVLGDALQKKSRKVDAKGKLFLELGFITPSVGEKHREAIEGLSKKTGWDLRISSLVNQHALKSLAKEMVGAFMEVAKDPSYFPRRNVVRVYVRGGGEIHGLEEEFLDQTGCALEIQSI